MLDPEKTDDGKIFYNIFTAMRLKDALSSTLLVNPYGAHWLNPRLISHELLEIVRSVTIWFVNKG